MKILIRNAVYIGDDIAGFRCIQCNQVVASMFGDICNACKSANKAHREYLKVLKETKEAIEKNTQAIEKREV